MRYFPCWRAGCSITLFQPVVPGLFYNQGAWPEANSVVCIQEGSNEGLAKR